MFAVPRANDFTKVAPSGSRAMSISVMLEALSTTPYQGFYTAGPEQPVDFPSLLLFSDLYVSHVLFPWTSIKSAMHLIHVVLSAGRQSLLIISGPFFHVSFTS